MIEVHENVDNLSKLSKSIRFCLVAVIVNYVTLICSLLTFLAFCHQ